MSKNTPHDVESLFEENLGLVYAAYDRLPDTDIKKKYKDDIISEGMRGLEHSIMSLDPDKGHNSTYLYGGIQLAMYNYMRSIKKHNNTYSIDSVVGFNNDGKAVTLEETLEDGSSEDMFTIDDVIDEYVDIYKKYYPRTSKNTADRLRKILMKMYEGYNQVEISEELGVSKQLINAEMRNIRKALIEEGVYRI